MTLSNQSEFAEDPLYSNIFGAGEGRNSAPPPMGQSLLIHEVSRSHSDTPQSTGLLWRSDQPVAETSTWQHTTLTTDRHPCPGGIRTHNVSTRAAADLCLRPRCHWDRQNLCIHFIFSFMLFMSSSTLCYGFHRNRKHVRVDIINPLNPELNPTCYLLALLGAHHFLHVSRIRVRLLTFRLLMSYIYGAPIHDVSRSHTTTQHSR